MTPHVSALVAAGAVAHADGTVVPWWSFGKTVLAAATLRLVADGVLSLDEAFGDGGATLRQALQHRAGFADYGMLRAYQEAVAAGAPPWPREEMLGRVERLPRPPIGTFSYSNVAYHLLVRLIEQRSGRSADEALARLVFEPLGIAGVRSADTQADLAATAWGNAHGYDPAWVYHGLLIGPPAAAALLLDRLLAGRLLPAALLAEMRTSIPAGAPVDGRPWREPAYGLGLMCGIGDPPLRLEGHTGGGPGSRIAVYRAAATGRTACVASPGEDEGAVERAAIQAASAD